MIVTTESKAQNWRAVVVFDDRHDALIFVSRSSTHVRSERIGSFMELLDEEERGHATAIRMQQWSGSPDAGRWVHKTDLKLTAPALARVAAYVRNTCFGTKHSRTSCASECCHTETTR